MTYDATHMDAISRQLSDTRIDILLIVRDLSKKRGLRARPFPYVPSNATAADLKNIATAEVHKSLDRIPLVMKHDGAFSLSCRTPLDDERGEVARLHRIARGLDCYSGVPVIKAAIGWLDSVGRQAASGGRHWTVGLRRRSLLPRQRVVRGTAYYHPYRSVCPNRSTTARSAHRQDDG